MSIKVAGIPGSLREGSFNKGLLRAAIELAPAGMEIQMFTRLGDIPPYNADVDDKGNPEPLQALKERFAKRTRCSSQRRSITMVYRGY